MTDGRSIGRPAPDGDRRQRLRARLAARAGITLPTDLPQGVIGVGTDQRTYSLAPAGQQAPLLLVLHGGGGTGLGMAGLCGLHERGPAAGMAAVFPDGKNRGWNDGRQGTGLRNRQDSDDVAFLNQLISRLVDEGVADPRAVFAVGMSNGAFMSEHLAREALAPLAGIVLVAGSAGQAGRQLTETPKRPATMIAFCGTADPIVPYAGGPVTIGLGARRPDAAAPRGTAVPIEVVAADWARANGLPPTPMAESLAVGTGDFPISRLTWQQSGRPSVVLHRIEGGGHTWPGGSQYLPERVVGPRSTSLDATGVLLGSIRAVLGS